ncbi:MAG: hypothetical protein WBI57_00950 [Desulfobacterales bacterium]
MIEWKLPGGIGRPVYRYIVSKAAKKYIIFSSEIYSLIIKTGLNKGHKTEPDEWFETGYKKVIIVSKIQ